MYTFVSKNLLHGTTYFVSCFKIVKGSCKSCEKILSKLFCKMLNPPFQTFSFSWNAWQKTSPQKIFITIASISHKCNMCNMKCNSIKVENRIAIYLLDWLIFCYNLRQVNQFFSLSNPTNNLSVNLVSWDYLCFCLNTMLWWRIPISIHTKLRLYFDFNQSNCYHISIIEYHVKITLVGGLIELFHFLTDYYI